MTITSLGYAGTIAPHAPWAQYQQSLGHDYMVAGVDALKVSVVTGGTRQLSIASGMAGGKGILDTVTSETVQLPTVASGTNWFLIVLRRTWGLTKATTLEVINAGTDPSILPARSMNPGVVDDQPLALVPLAAGSNTPGAVVDLRVIGTHAKGIYLAFDERVLQYMLQPGVHVRIGLTVWSRVLNSTGTGYTWVKDTAAVVLPSASNASVMTLDSTSTSKWAFNGTGTRILQDRNTINLGVSVFRTTGTITMGDGGNVGNVKVGTLLPAYRPAFPQLCDVEYRGRKTASGGNLWAQGLLQVNPAGEIYFLSGVQGLHIYPSATERAFTGSCTYLIQGS